MKDLTVVVPFMRYRVPGAIMSGLVVLLSIVALAVNGLNYALDFTGGTQVQMLYETPPDLEEIRQLLEQNGYPNEVTTLGSDTTVQIRIQDGAEGEDVHTESGETAVVVSNLLIDAVDGAATFGGSSYIGAQVGDELKEKGGMGMLVATGLLMLYIAIRFQFKFAVGAVLSVTHDVIAMLGFIAITRLDFDLNVLAAILAIIGYSLNDTVVVADRIRENFRMLRGATPEEIVDTAVSQTLVRTMITAVTTLLVLFALYIYGGKVLEGFSLVMIAGVLVGTYSSVYIASSALMFMNLTKEDMMPPEKDKAELDALP
ncbi:MAG: protein translocase subunit SecF [Pseudomonadota bacterium]|nr:protein translocase subunit SecF [Pseudomonadota bacterium]